AEDGIRDRNVTGVQTCALPILIHSVKPGGHVIFEVYPEEQLAYKTGGPPSFDMLYNPIDILNWIDDYKCIHFYYGEARRDEGKRSEERRVGKECRSRRTMDD